MSFTEKIKNYDASKSGAYELNIVRKILYKLYDKGLEKTRKEFVSKLSTLGIKHTKISEEYYEELENAGLPYSIICYAHNNPQEYIAVASEGDMSKYSDEFKKVLVKLGMPEWEFNLEK